MTLNHGRYILTLFLILAAMMAGAVTVDEVPNVHVADRHRFVSDQAGVLSPETESRLNAAIDSVWASTSAEMTVAIVDEVDNSMTPDEFATKLFEKWGIGKSDKDNGLLLLISIGDRKAVIRTGYGVEGAIPDIIAGRIIRNDMAPYFRQGDYESGTVAGVAALVGRLTDPAVAEELHSAIPSDRRRLPAEDNDLDSASFFNMYLWFSLAIGVVALVWVISTIFSSRGQNEVVRYRRLDTLRSTLIFLSFLTLGMALPALLIMRYKARRLRRHSRKCPNCNTPMQLVDEEHDNDYLTHAQDVEEKLDSIDYDVWLCPSCHATEVLPYINLHNNYTVCPRCKARAVSIVDSRVTVPPTTRREGVRTTTYVCKACGNREDKSSRIPRRTDDSAAIAAGAILGSLSGRGGGGGGFSGGSFGGGLTGGGGASGGW